MMDPCTLTGGELIAVLQQQGIAENDPRVIATFSFLQEKVDTALTKEELSDVTKKVAGSASLFELYRPSVLPVLHRRQGALGSPHRE